MLLITFHGQSANAPPDPSHINNIYGYDEQAVDPAGQPKVYPNVLSVSNGATPLSELRAIALVDGLLYVANGGKSVSNVLTFSQVAGTSPAFGSPQVFIPSSATIDHPFGITSMGPATTGGPSTWWVSNQDSNVVAMVTSPSPYTQANPLPESGPSGTYLQALLTALNDQRPAKHQEPKPWPATFLPGSFIASNSNQKPLPEVSVVATPWGGLSAAIGPDPADAGQKSKDKVQNSVRGVVFDSGILYVADEVGNAVRMYDPATGIPWGSATATGPVHLLVNDGYLFVTTDDGVLYGKCPSPPTSPPALPGDFPHKHATIPPYPDPPAGYDSSVSITLAPLSLTPEPPSPSGMTFDGAGNFYVASRKEKLVYQYTPTKTTDGSLAYTATANGNPLISATNIPDFPEFLLWYPWTSS